MIINQQITPEKLQPLLDHFWLVSGQKIKLIDAHYDTTKGSPVFTANGKYTTRGWTEWTQGFQFGSAILQYDATGETEFLNTGRQKTLEIMAPHISHIGVHDHGFNNVSTYGSLLRLMKEGKIEHNGWEQHFYELALKISGAVQASRWTKTTTGGFIYSFNGPHSLFVDTIRSCRALMLSHLLGHVLMAENDIKINLLERALLHCRSTARYAVYYGEGRDNFDCCGRTAHESIFNTNDGNYRAPNSQQGYSGFTTWTRGLAWAMCGFAEELEFLKTLSKNALQNFVGLEDIGLEMEKATRAVCDFYIEHSCHDGIPFWDTGAPNLYQLGNCYNRMSDPYNEWEPLDSSAAAIGAQGLLRFGNYLKQQGKMDDGTRYWQAGLTILQTLLQEPYLSTDPTHQGLLLHSVYHWPNRWDYVPEGSTIPYGESSMWGDYHLRELALYIQKMINNEPYYTFFNSVQ